MIRFSQSLASLEKQQVLDQAAATGDDYHLDKCGPMAYLSPGPWRRRWGRGRKETLDT
jgi:hypothetical protein